MRVGILYNPFSESCVRFSEAAASWLRARGLDVWRGASHLGREDSSIECCDLVVAAGGDGTVGAFFRGAGDVDVGHCFASRCFLPTRR